MKVGNLYRTTFCVWWRTEMVGPSLVVPRGELFVFLREVPTGTATFLYKEGILFATLNFAEKYLEEVQ